MYSYNKKIIFEAQHLCRQRTALFRRRLHTNFLRSAQCLIISSARKSETTRAWTSESARAGALRGRSAKSFSPVKGLPPRPPNPLFLLRQRRLLWSSRRPSRISLRRARELSYPLIGGFTGNSILKTTVFSPSWKRSTFPPWRWMTILDRGKSTTVHSLVSSI